MHAEEDRGCCRHSGLVKRSKRLKAIDSRHLHVENDDVWFQLAGHLDGPMAIRCSAHDVEVVGENRGDGVEDRAVVVYDKNSRPSYGVPAQAVREGTVHRP
jgi:hypothetical protein